MATFKAVVLRGDRHTKTDGTSNVKIRITHKRRQLYMATELFIDPEQMNSKTGQVDSGKNIVFLNHAITSWILKCQKADILIGDKRELLSIADIKKIILEGDTKENLDFFVFAEQLVAETKNEGTASQYRFTAASIRKFAGPVLPFSEINLGFLKRYEVFLWNNGARNGIVNYMTTFRAIFNKARDTYNDEDIQIIRIPHYPFRKYEMPKRKLKSKDHVLTVGEMKVLVNYLPQNKGEEYAKDMFLLMFYLIGIESKDLFFLQPMKNGRIFYDRFKTGREYSIKVEPEVAAIFEKYAGKNTLINAADHYKNSRTFTHAINRYLHGEKFHKITGINKKIGIDKQITTKWARHTWATIARNECRIDKDDVALCLGHEDADNKVTDVYIKYDYRIIDEANRSVLNTLTG